MTVLVTGGMGYIGSHTCVELLEQGMDVVIVDNLVNSSAEAGRRVEQITGKSVTFYQIDYFAEARLTRQQSRDEALTLLQAASTAEGASQETIDSVMGAISAMANDSMTETQIENLLLAKDFAECVVYVTDEGVTVAVPAPEEGLTEAQVATITDAIVGETDYTAPQIKVIEVKN